MSWIKYPAQSSTWNTSSTSILKYFDIRSINSADGVLSPRSILPTVATLKEEGFEVVVVRSLNEITDDIYDLEEFVNTITDMGIWLYSLGVGPVPITVSHAEDFGC